MKEILELTKAETGIAGVEQYREVARVITVLQDKIKGYEEMIKREAMEQFKKNEKLAKVEIGGFTVTRVRRGTKRAVRSLGEMYAEGAIGVSLEYKIDTKALNEYVKANGELPDGFVEEVKEYYLTKINDEK